MIDELLQEKKFSKYKWIQMNELVIPFYYNYEEMNMNIKEVKRIEECGTYLKFKVYNFNDEYVKKLVGANFCKDKFCQICNWRRSLKYRNMYFKVLESLFKEREYKVLFLTLTIKDPDVDNLKEVLKQLNYGFKKLTLNKKFKKIVKGYIKSLECHFKKSDKRKVHPHFHLMLLVNKSYFSKSKDDYIKYSEWRELWQKALGVDYLPQVSISSVRVNNKDELMAILREVLKYPFKSNYNLKGVKLEDFKKFRNILKNMRLISSGGIIKKRYKELFLNKDKKDNKDDEDLVFVENDNKVVGELVGEAVYVFKQPGWHFLEKLNLKEKSN
jgi:plasmid rolling circle replication initiator protein Rep